MKILRYIRRYGKTALLVGWLLYLGYALTSGKIEVQTAFDKLTSTEIITLLLGAW